MSVFAQRRSRVFAGAFCLFGLLAGGDTRSATWMLVAVAMCSSVLMLWGRYASAVPLVVRRPAEVTR